MLGVTKPITSPRPLGAEATSTIAAMPDKLTPLLQAAVTLVALRILARLQLPHPTARQLLAALGVGRSRAYELAKQIDDLLPGLHRPVGRPPDPTGPLGDDSTRFTITRLVRDFLLRHPGAAACMGPRAWYSTAFRIFVLDLLGPNGAASTLSLPEAADAIGVPRETLAQWLRQPVPQAEEEEQPTMPLAPGVVEQILALFARWSGSLVEFRRTLAEHHRISISIHLLRFLLELTGHRLPRRRRAKGDPEALRGALERFFPGAQLVADGKRLVIELDEVPYEVNWELAVDADTGAHVGFHVSATEDGQALLTTVDAARETLTEPPIAVTVDNRPSNHSEDVQQALEDQDILLMPTTVGRPENKAPVEGAFGLFAQQMPNITLSSGSAEELVQRVVHFVLWAYCVGRNQAPQSRRDGKSAIDLFAETQVTEEQRQQARQRLREIQRRIERRRDADRLRLDPVTRALVERELVDLDLSDPQGHFADGLTRLGLGPALEALAIFRAKQEADTVPGDFPERYLLGIAHNVANRNEDMAVYAELLRLRTDAHDMLLAPLLSELASLGPLGHSDLVDAVFARLANADATLDRRFWTFRLIDAFAALDLDERLQRGPWLARRVASLYALPLRDRDFLIATLAEKAVA